MKTRNLIWVILFCLLAADCAVVSAQNCEQVFLGQLEQAYHRKEKRFIRQVRSATPFQRVVNPPDLKTLPDDSILLIGKVFFTKETIRLIDEAKIVKSRFLCYMNPKSMVLDFAFIDLHKGARYVIHTAADGSGFALDCIQNNGLHSALIDFVKRYRPEIVFTTGCALWDGYMLFVKDSEVQTLNLRTGVMEPVSENNAYVKDNLNYSLGVMTKPDKIIPCY